MRVTSRNMRVTSSKKLLQRLNTGSNVQFVRALTSHAQKPGQLLEKCGYKQRRACTDRGLESPIPTNASEQNGWAAAGCLPLSRHLLLAEVDRQREPGVKVVT